MNNQRSMIKKISQIQPNVLNARRYKWRLVILGFLPLCLWVLFQNPLHDRLNFFITGDSLIIKKEAAGPSLHKNETPLSCSYSNSLDQVRFMRNLINAKTSLDIRNEERTYRVTVERNDTAGIRLMLHESPWLFGGSMFHVDWAVYDPRISPLVEEVDYREKAGFPRRVFSITTCTVQDLFNGTYSICCPRPKHSSHGCHKLEIVRHYQNFLIYRSPSQAALTTVFSTDWCPLGSGSLLKHRWEKELSHSNFPPCTFKDLSQLSSQGQWLRLHGRLEWVSTTTDCMAPNLDGEPIQSCFDRLSSLTIMGDSHMRVYTKYFLNKLFSQHYVHTELHGFVTDDIAKGDKFLYMFCRDDLAKRLYDKFLKPDSPAGKKKMTKKDILILNTGAWGLKEYPVTFYLNRTLPDLVKVLTGIRAQPTTADMSIIWVTMYPFPPQYYGDYRSEFTSMAADAFMTPSMLALGIKVFDLLPMILPRARQSVDSHHYLADENNHFQGSVGRALGDMLTAVACSMIDGDIS